MELKKKLIQALRRAAPDNRRCWGCDYEHNCSIHGCQLLHLAADQLEHLDKLVSDLERSASAEKHAAFRLGQMDMRESAVAALRGAANKTIGHTRYVLTIGAYMVKDLEVMS